MKPESSERSISLAQYIIENQCIVRDAAAWFGVSKSTVHKDVTQTLAHSSPPLFREVKRILKKTRRSGI